MFIYLNVEGVHGQRKFGNTCPKPEAGQHRKTIKWKCLLLSLIF